MAGSMNPFAQVLKNGLKLQIERYVKFYGVCENIRVHYYENTGVGWTGGLCGHHFFWAEYVMWNSVVEFVWPMKVRGELFRDYWQDKFNNLPREQQERFANNLKTVLSIGVFSRQFPELKLKLVRLDEEILKETSIIVRSTKTGFDEYNDMKKLGVDALTIPDKFREEFNQVARDLAESSNQY